MSIEVSRALDLDLEHINRDLADRTPEEIVAWAAETFDPGKIYSLTSAGLSAPLTLDLLQRTAEAGISPTIPVIHNDTGLLPDVVHEYLHEELGPAFGFTPIVCGPSQETVQDIEETELWKRDKALYRKLTKLDPLSNILREQRVQALITGVRQDQTENRQDLDIVTYGADGEIRVNPNFLTPKSEVEERLEYLVYTPTTVLGDDGSEIVVMEGRVPRHPLHLVVDFVDDWPFIGGPKEECGINSARRLMAPPSV